MKPETHKAIKKNKKGEEQVKENMTFEEAVQLLRKRGSQCSEILGRNFEDQTRRLGWKRWSSW